MFTWLFLLIAVVFGAAVTYFARRKGLSGTDLIRISARLQPAFLAAIAVAVVLLFVLDTYYVPAVVEFAAPTAVGLLIAGLLWRTHVLPKLHVPQTIDRYFGPLIGIAGLAALVAISTFFYENEPFVSDSCIELAHAEIFSSGKMKLSPPPPELLPFLNNIYGLVRDDVWRSQYFPGHIVCMAAANLAGIPWAVNPILGAGCLWLLYSIAGSLYGKRTGQLAALLLLFSPFFLILQSEMMSHGSTLFFTLAAFRLLCAPLSARSRPWQEWLGGFCLGMALISRPLSALPAAAVIMAAPPFIWSADQNRGPRRWLWAAAGGVIPIAFMLFDNYVATGNVLSPGYSLTHPELHRLGFHGDFTLKIGVHNSVEKLSLWNIWLFGWPLTSYATVIALFVMRRAQRADWLFLVMTLLLSFAYTFYVFHDDYFGPRFLYEAEGWMAILAARGCAEIYRGLRNALKGLEMQRHLAGLCALVLLVLLVNAPFKAWQVTEFKGYRNFIVARRENLIKPLKPYLDDPSAVVFVNFSYPDYLFIYSMRYYPDGPLFPVDLGERNKAFIEAFPDRNYYRLAGGIVSPMSIDRNKAVAAN